MPSLQDENRQLLQQLRQQSAPQQQSQAGEDLSSGSRMGYVGLGGTVGAILGSPLGPIGTVGGGALGAAAGSMVADLTQGRTDPLEQIGRAAKEALFDVGIGVGSQAVKGVARAGGRALTRKVAGIGSRQVAEAAESARLGIHQDPMSMATKKFPEQFGNVVGKVPFAGAPLRRSAEKRLSTAASALKGKAKTSGMDQTILDAFRMDSRGQVVDINFTGLDRKLGINNPGGERFKKTIKKVIGAGGDPADFVKTYQLAKRAFEAAPSDASDMIARRWTLGGVGLAGLTGLGAAYSGAPGLISGAIFLSLVRSGSKALSNPDVLKPLSAALTPKARDGLVIGATIRALRAMNEPDAETLADDIESNVNG